MDRNILEKRFGELLKNTDNDNHLKCDILINNENKTIGLFQNKVDNKIYFYIMGDCLVEFDDMEDNMLINIFNNIQNK